MSKGKNRFVTVAAIGGTAVILWLLFKGGTAGAVAAAPTVTVRGGEGSMPTFAIPGNTINFSGNDSRLVFSPGEFSGVDFTLPDFGGFSGGNSGGGDIYILPPASAPGNGGGGNSNCRSCGGGYSAPSGGAVSYGASSGGVVPGNTTIFPGAAGR